MQKVVKSSVNIYGFHKKTLYPAGLSVRRVLGYKLYFSFIARYIKF